MPERERDSPRSAVGIAAGGSVTLGETVRRVTEALRDAGIAEPLAEARRLLVQAGACRALDLVTRPELPVEAAMRELIDAWTARRASHEPLSRIAGEREFYGRTFELSADTLDPRPDTETLIGAVLQLSGEMGRRDRPLRILDVGTGTGCILLTLLAELPLAHGVGVDIAEGAVMTARRNAARLHLDDRAEFVVGDGPAAAAGRFDLVVANPPYIPRSAIAELEPEVRNFDPLAALEGPGENGLGFYRIWIPQIECCLSADGAALFEVGAGQAGEVAGLMEKVWLCEPGSARRWRDLGGHERVVAVMSQIHARRE